MPLADDILNDLEITARPGNIPGRLVELTGPNAPAPLLNFFNYLSPRALPPLVAALRAQRGFGHNEEGYDYLAAAASEEPATVAVYDFVGRVEMSAPAFQRLAARFLVQLVQVAAARQDAMLQQPWWEEFVQDTQALAEQAEI